jgi:hypothetical protein
LLHRKSIRFVSQIPGFSPIPRSLFTVGIVFASLAHFFFKYRDNFTGSFVNGGDSTHAPQSGLAEKLEGTLRASMARLPTKKVIRL